MTQQNPEPRKPRKLRLAKETLRRLEQQRPGIIGGTSMFLSCNIFCSKHCHG